MFPEHPGHLGPADLLPTGSPGPTITCLTRLFPELQTTGHHCCKPRTLTLASVSLLCLACLISRHLPVHKSDKDLRRQHGHHCPLTSDSVHSTDLLLCALLGSSARSRLSFPPPAHLTDRGPARLASPSEEITRSYWSLLGASNKEPPFLIQALIQFGRD